MKTKGNNSQRHEEKRGDGKVEIREDLQDASKGKDLSYLNEMPQMGGYEGVKAGAPPPKEDGKNKGTNSAKEK
jgi:hypothetical protein